MPITIPRMVVHLDGANMSINVFCVNLVPISSQNVTVDDTEPTVGVLAGSQLGWLIHLLVWRVGELLTGRRTQRWGRCGAGFGL